MKLIHVIQNTADLYRSILSIYHTNMHCYVNTVDTRSPAGFGTS